MKSAHLIILLIVLLPLPSISHAGWWTDAKKAVSKTVSNVVSGIGATKDILLQSADQLVCSSMKSSTSPWRSRYYPINWAPPTARGSDTTLIQDFSFVGYKEGLVPLPNLNDGSYKAFNVMQYGADRTAYKDSSAAITKAYQALQNSKQKGYLYFPKGSYKIDKIVRLKGSPIIKGDGAGQTTLIFTRKDPDSLSSVNASLVLGGNEPLTYPKEYVKLNSPKYVNYVVVPSTTSLKVGDQITIGWNINASFIAQFGMSGIWPIKGETAIFQREIIRTLVLGTNTYLFFNAPLRYEVSKQNGAYVAKKVYAAQDCGLEALSISSSDSNTVAYNTPYHETIAFENAKNCYMKNVTSVGNSKNSSMHLLNTGLHIHNSANITIENVHLKNVQNRANGGNGYLFLVVGSNEILIVNSSGENSRHSFVTSGWGNAGIVLSNFKSKGSEGWESELQRKTIGSLPKLSDFHKYLTFGSLIENSDLIDGFVIGNRGTISDGAGHTGTDTVFWNIRGANDCSHLASYQYGVGYVIGTTNIEVDVLINSKRNEFLNILLAGNNRIGTAPDDILEGKNAGRGLIPQSLYYDQVQKRKQRIGK